MNKNLLKICLVIALTAAAAGSAQAASTIQSALTIGGGTFSPSNKVMMSVDSSVSAYTAKSRHQNGDRLMATNNADPKMYWKTVATGQTTIEASATSETMGGSSWTSL